MIARNLCKLTGCRATVCFMLLFIGTIPQPPISAASVTKGDPVKQSDEPHGHPPDNKTGRQPRTPESQGGSGWVLPTAIGAGVGVALLATWLHGKENGEKILDTKGPQIENHFNMSGFTIKGLCKGGWPIVLDFQIETGGTALLSVHNKKSSTEFPIASNGNHRTERKVFLPREFGDELTAGVYTIRGLSSSASGQPHPVYLRVYALAAGERAVGSAAIDLLSFGPGTVPRSGEAQFGFHSHAEFGAGQAEFLRIGLHDGQIMNSLDDKQAVYHKIAYGSTITETWKARKAKTGEHLLQVRAWRSISNGGDFVVAWSADLVEVQ